MSSISILPISLLNKDYESNIRFYFNCRFKLKSNVDEIFEELKKLFESDVSPNNIEVLNKWAEEITYQDDMPTVYQFSIEQTNTLKKLEFNFKSTDSTDTQEMKFYSFCRIQLNIKLSDILIELNKLFDKKAPSLHTLNIWILNDSKKELNLKSIDLIEESYMHKTCKIECGKSLNKKSYETLLEELKLVTEQNHSLQDQIATIHCQFGLRTVQRKYSDQLMNFKNDIKNLNIDQNSDDSKANESVENLKKKIIILQDEIATLKLHKLNLLDEKNELVEDQAVLKTLNDALNLELTESIDTEPILADLENTKEQNTRFKAMLKSFNDEKKTLDDKIAKLNTDLEYSESRVNSLNLENTKLMQESKQLSLKSSEEIEKLNKEMEKSAKKCSDLELLLSEKNAKLEESLEKFSRLEKQLNQRKSTDQVVINKVEDTNDSVNTENKEKIKKLTKKLEESYAETRNWAKNYETAINKLKEFEVNLIKEREEKATEKQKIEFDLSLIKVDLAEKIKKIQKLEIDLNEYSDNFQVSETVYKECKNENEKLKFEVEHLKSQIQTNTEPSFITQVRNKRLETVLQQKTELETENNTLKYQIAQYEINVQDLNKKIQKYEEEISANETKSNLLREEIQKLIEAKSLVTENFENLKNETNTKIIDIENKIKLVVQENTTLKTDLSQKNIEIEKLSNEIKSFIEKNKKIQDTVTSLEQSLFKATNDTTTQNEIKALKDSLNEKNTLIGQLNENHHIKIKSIEENHKNLLETHQNVISDYEIKLNNLKNVLNYHEAKNNDLTDSQSSLEANLSDSQNNLKAKEEILNSQSLKINELEAESLENDKKIKILTLTITNLEKEVNELKDSGRLKTSEHVDLENERIKINEHLKSLYEFSKLKLNEVKDETMGDGEANQFENYVYIDEIKKAINQLEEKIRKLSKHLDRSQHDNTYLRDFNHQLSIENAELRYEITKIKKKEENQQQIIHLTGQPANKSFNASDDDIIELPVRF
jgi:chromosome segregation ATPase